MSRGSIFALGAFTRKGFVLFWTALLLSTLVIQYVAAVAPARALGAAAPRAAAASTNAAASCGLVPLDVEIILDQSGSMGSNSNNGHTREYWAQQAADQLVSDLQANGGVGTGPATSTGGRHRVGLTTFNGAATPGYVVRAALATQDAATITTTIDGLTPSGNTPFKAGMAGGAGDLSAHKRTTDFGLTVRHVIVFLSDGRPNPDPGQRPSPTEIATFKGAADEVFSIAIGSGGSGSNQVDLALMESLAKPDDAAHYTNIVDASQLPAFFKGIFDTIACPTTPTITTQVQKTTADFGGTVTDSATITGTGGKASGTVTFAVCGPTTAAQDCTTGSTPVGQPVAVTTTSTGGTATSSAFTVGLTGGAAGWYCWRADYTPDGSANYNPASGTVKTNECFNVAAATISVTKTANPVGPVTYPSPVGFDIVVHNTGTTTTLGVHVTDTLPTSVTGWAYATPLPSGVNCTITSGVLDCTKASLAAGDSFTVHVSGTPAPAACGTVTNTASVGTSNDGSDSSKASVTVLCPDLKVTKTPDGLKINATDTATFTIKVENVGTGAANGVTVTDQLPAGTWTPNNQACTINGSNLMTCTVGTLAAGDSVTYGVSRPTTKNDCATIDNSANATASNEPSDRLGNNTDAGSIIVQCATIGITKTADSTTVNAGDQIGFTVTVTNSGAGTAYGVSATDTLPAGGHNWSIESQSGSGTWVLNGSVLAWTGDLAGKASSTVHIVAKTDATSCPSVKNDAAVTTRNDGNPDPVSASVTVNCPDVTITKTGNGTISAGGVASFKITVSNSGLGTAYGVEVKDLVLPAGVAWAVDDTTHCSIASGAMTCTWASLAKGAQATVTLSGTTSPAVCGSLTNSATVSAANEPQAAVNGGNSASDTITVNCPNLAVVKTADKSPISGGETAAFTITLTNTGAGTASGVTLNDALPSGVHWVIDPLVDGCSIASNQLSCAWATLNPGATQVVHISGETTAANCGTLTNTVTVGAANEPTDEVTRANNTSTATIAVGCPTVVITKTADAASVSAGDQIGFTIAVTNNGAGTAFGVTVDDPLPTNPGLGAWTISPASVGWSIVGGHLVYGPASLAGNKTTISAHVVASTTSATCGGSVVNTANLHYNGNDTPLRDSSSVTVNCPDVMVSKVGNGPVLAGQTASFTITASNAGPGTATGVVITDPLPAGVDWAVSKDGCSITDGTLTCEVGTLEKGGRFAVTVYGATTAANCGDLPNTASVSATNEPEANLDNNQASASDAVVCAAITVAKTAGTAADGATLTLANPGNVLFTYVVTNTGTAALQGIVVVDDNGTPSNTADDVTIICPKTTLAAGESMTCTTTLPVGYGTRTNIATVTAHAVLAPDATVSATDDAVVVVPEPEVTPSPTPKPTPTPTPKITLPPTSTVDEGTSGGQTGSGLLLVLAAVGGLMLLAGILVPAPARARRRTRRS